MWKKYRKDDFLSDKDRHGYVTWDMDSNIQRELGEETGIIAFCSHIFFSDKNRAPQILESCHYGWEIIEVSVENMERII